MEELDEDIVKSVTDVNNSVPSRDISFDNNRFDVCLIFESVIDPI